MQIEISINISNSWYCAIDVECGFKDQGNHERILLFNK